MTANHARANDIARLREAVAPVRLKRHDALKILADERRDVLVGIINEYAGVTTYSAAVHVLDTEPRLQTLCETCGWTMAMICPECAEGCGCATGCTGWRHRDYGFDDDDPEDAGMPGEWDDDFEDWEEAFESDPDALDDDYEAEPLDDESYNEEPPEPGGEYDWSGTRSGTWEGSPDATSSEPPF